MNPAPEDRQLGEYRLKELLHENAISRTWLAEQVSVSRLVLVDELRAQAADQRDAFLAEVRAKASVDHPLIGSVYEAVAEPDLCFYAHELLAGDTLAQRLAKRKTFMPGRLSHVLRRVSEANIQQETLGQATSPLELEAVYLDDQDVIRLKNLAIASPRLEEQSRRDVVHMGNALVPLVAIGQPGTTRLLTLFSWMRGEGLEAPISWSQVRDFCMQIEHQLADPLSILTPTRSASIVRKKPIASTAIVTCLAIIAIVALAFQLRPPEPSGPSRVSLPEPVSIPAGVHPTPDGLEEELPAFKIAAHETTIGQYAEFIDRLEVLAKDHNENIFNSPDQPPEKTSHEPDDWSALLPAAKSKGNWHNLSVTLDSPVTGIDWWDAFAFAEWKKARLPTQEEWFAAVTTQVKIPAAIPPAGYDSVTTVTTDHTPAGMIDMAGSVAEWTAKAAPNPANPLGDKFWIIIGGSYLKPGSNALSREWVANRSLRRPDLGFRVVLDAE